MSDFSVSRQNMVQSQLYPNGVITPEVLAAFTDVRREMFVPEPLRSVAYSDDALALGQGRVLLAPTILARMIEAVAIQSYDHVLCIGGGSGYGAAIAARLATEGGVIDLECDEFLTPLYDHAVAMGEVVGVHRQVAPLLAAVNGSVTYQVMVVQGAIAELPALWAQSLAIGGRLVAPILPAGARVATVMLYGRDPSGHVSGRPLFDTVMPYLPGLAPTPRFALA